ncbi:MAG: DUF4159 domain-containing protein [Gemmataceae bacterium]|nr:DUF4159 domain-containing protein [Gemmataceae bacterium]
MYRFWLVPVSLLLFTGLSSQAQQDKTKLKKEPLAERVKTSIDRAVRYLREQERNGGWEPPTLQPGIRGGWTALSVLALLNAGVPVDDPVIQRGLRFLRSVDSPMTYVRAIQTMVFVEAGQVEDKQRIQDNIKWLIEARAGSGDWGYNKGSPSGDNSNTQYALLGLWAGSQAGVEINRALWENIRKYYLETQQQTKLPSEGYWFYYRDRSGPGQEFTMTTAGLCGLLIAGMELNVGRENIEADGTASNCGVYKDNPALSKSLNWLGKRFKVDLPAAVFYSLYGIERAGRLTGLRFLGEYDWYREGCDYLVRTQRADGSWHIDQRWDGYPVVSTSFALLFLSKGRTPILMSKLVHGDWPRRDQDWNNDRNDLRHLVNFSSKELFHKLPLAWQSFDIMLAAQTKKGGQLTEEDEIEITSDLLQSPILYITGHLSPAQRFQAVEKKLLQRYIDNGGFIVAEACCGSPDFDRGFKKLVAELWPDNELAYLDADHAVWRAHFPVSPGDPAKLMGLSSGCKTVLIYSPQDLSCHWESNNHANGKTLKAFHLGANIVAYATGREPPKPRLTETAVASNRDDAGKMPRGYLKVAQLKHGGDWQPAPKAMRNLMDHMRKFAGMDVVLKTEEIQAFNRGIVDFKFIYMHGRREFSMAAGDLDPLRFNLENGGLLFADAACGKEVFDKSFRRFVAQLFPNEKLVPVPAEDELYSKELNGVALTEENIRYRNERGGQMRNRAPFLEGVKVNGRWAVLYSKYDIGCALEKHQASDCLGYHPDSAFRLATAAVLYMLRP